RTAILRRWLARFAVLMPTRQQINQLWQEVALARHDAEPQLLLSQYQIRRYQQQLYLLPHYQTLADLQLEWHMQQALCLPDGLGQLICGKGTCRVRQPLATEKVTIRFQAQGQFTVIGRQGSRKIKKLWQELQVPPWQRQRIP